MSGGQPVQGGAGRRRKPAGLWRQVPSLTAVDVLVQTARQTGGTFGLSADDAARRFDEGFRFVSVATGVRLLGRARRAS